MRVYALSPYNMPGHTKEVCLIVVPLLQTGEQEQEEVPQRAQDHTAREW